MDWPIAPIVTERLTLRAATGEDHELFERVLTDPMIRAHLGGPVPAAELAKRVADMPWRGVFTIELTATGDPIGLVHIGRYRTGDIELSYELVPEEWGNGCAAEACAAALDWAFGWLPRGDRIVAVTQAANQRSIRLLERVGMTPCDHFDEWGEPQVMMQLTTPASAPTNTSAPTPHAADPAVIAVEQALAARGVTARTVWFDGAVATAAQAAAQLGAEVGAIANSLVFTFDGEPLLILSSGGHRVDVKVIGRLLGGKVRTATPDFAHEATGQRVGGVSPIGHPTPIRTLVDVDLGAFETVWAAAGHSHCVFPTTFDELVELTGGTPVTVVREQPREHPDD